MQEKTLTINMKNFDDKLKRINAFDGQIKIGAKEFNSSTNRTGKGKPSSGYMSPEHAKIIEDTKKPKYVHKNEKDWIKFDKCPICDSGHFENFVERMGLIFVRCTKCSHVFQNPIVTQEVAGQIYADDKTAYDIYTQKIQIDIDDIKYDYGLDLIEDVGNINKNRILEIGCGAGGFLIKAKKRGYKSCVGVDANENYQQIYKKNNDICFISGTFEKIEPEKLGEPFDVVAMWSVLEHIYNPKKFLDNLKHIINKNGVLFIYVPNLKSLATRIIREKSPCFNWQHAHMFYEKTLDLLMDKVGFKPIHKETVITEIENIKSYLSGEFPYHGYGDPESLFDFITPEYIHKNLLGSRLIGIYQIK